MVLCLYVVKDCGFPSCIDAQTILMHTYSIYISVLSKILLKNVSFVLVMRRFIFYDIEKEL